MKKVNEIIINEFRNIYPEVYFAQLWLLNRGKERNKV
jgi:hypothetical protein